MPLFGRCHLVDEPCLREKGRVLKITDVPALGGEEFAQFLESFPGTDGFFDSCFALRFVRDNASLGQEDAAGLDAEFLEVFRAFSLQRIHRFDHLDGVPDGKAERLIHVRQDGTGVAAEILSDLDHRSRENRRLFDVLHEGPAAEFHVEEDGVAPGRELFGHDGRGNEGDGFDRPGHVTQGIEFLVGRDEFGGLARDRDPDALHLVLEFAFAQGDAHPRHGFHLVERSPGMAEAAPGRLREFRPAGGNEGPEDQTGLVADPAGAMLVDLDPGDVA